MKEHNCTKSKKSKDSRRRRSTQSNKAEEFDPASVGTVGCNNTYPDHHPARNLEPENSDQHFSVAEAEPGKEEADMGKVDKIRVSRETTTSIEAEPKADEATCSQHEAEEHLQTALPGVAETEAEHKEEQPDRRGE